MVVALAEFVDQDQYAEMACSVEWLVAKLFVIQIAVELVAVVAAVVVAVLERIEMPVHTAD